MRRWLVGVLLGVGVLGGGAWARDLDPGRAEIARLTALVPGVPIMPLPQGPGAVAFTPAQSLTVDALRGVAFDAEPPVPGAIPAGIDPRHLDGFPTGTAPYVAHGIRPFRFTHFTVEFNYGGWYNRDMIRYAASHGFSMLFPYAIDITQPTEFPAGTPYLAWGGWVDWPKWMPAHGTTYPRWDQLMDLDVPALLAAEQETIFGGHTAHPERYGGTLMVDQENEYCDPASLRRQAWYPKDGTAAEQAAFERKYYQGYGRSLSAIADLAHRIGWKQVGIYDGMQPVPRTWWGLEKLRPDPKTDWAWHAFGKEVYGAYDIIYSDVYCFYPLPQNVAYVLASIDLNREFLKQAGVPQKPIRPYYWTLYHGGDGNYHWWANQPLSNAETRAMTAMNFFTGTDGMTLWNWSEVSSHHVTPLLVKRGEAMVGNDVMLHTAFLCMAEGADAPHAFRKGDMLHILGVDEKTGIARFQQIPTVRVEHGTLTPLADFDATKDRPTYALPQDVLQSYLRAASEPVAAMVEGLALVKPLEYLLRHGTVKVDVSAQEQFAKTLPIVRRVQYGPYHIFITYDPLAAIGGAPREIVLTDFDGRKGVTVTVPADAQTRIFLAQDQ